MRGVWSLGGQRYLDTADQLNRADAHRYTTKSIWALVAASKWLAMWVHVHHVGDVVQAYHVVRRVASETRCRHHFSASHSRTWSQNCISLPEGFHRLLISCIIHDVSYIIPHTSYIILRDMHITLIPGSRWRGSPPTQASKKSLSNRNRPELGTADSQYTFILDCHATLLSQ